MLINVRVIPRAKKIRVDNFKDGLKVYISEPALEDRANKKLVQVLAKHFNTKKYNITIVKGEKQRDKVVEISEDS